MNITNLRFFIPSWGIYLCIMGALGATWIVQAAAYDSSQTWTPTWEGTCSGSWDEQPKEDPDDEEEEIVSALMLNCAGHPKFKASTDFTIDYYRAQVQTVNCVQSLGSYSNRLKWECTIGEPT